MSSRPHVKQARRAAISTSAAGIVVPFACGFALGELLPAAMLPQPDQRTITSLFLGTALSIASVKIVAMVVREMGFMRRNVGMTLIASAIIDDTVGWIIVAIISGLAVPRTGGRTRFGSERARNGNLLLRRALRWAGVSCSASSAGPTTILASAGGHRNSRRHGHDGAHHTFDWRTYGAGCVRGRDPRRRVADPDPPHRRTMRGLVVALFMPIFFACPVGTSTCTRLDLADSH